MATTSYTTWDFANYHVQQDMQPGSFVNAESTLIASGPPSITPITKAGQPVSNPSTVYPIGLVESIGIQQSKQLQRLFEIGSSRSYFIPGRVIGSVNLGRTFYAGPSLLRTLYAYYKVTGNDVPETIEGFDGESIDNPSKDLLDLYGAEELKTVRRSPGEDGFYINLASDIFNLGTGLAVYFKTSYATTVGAFYMEQVHVQGHQVSVSSGSVLIMEGASAQFDRIVPIKMLNG